MRLISFPTEEGDVFVNPEWVAAVLPDDQDEKRCYVIFGGPAADQNGVDGPLRVLMAAEAVAKALE